MRIEFLIGRSGAPRPWRASDKAVARKVGEKFRDLPPTAAGDSVLGPRLGPCSYRFWGLHPKPLPRTLRSGSDRPISTQNPSTQGSKP